MKENQRQINFLPSCVIFCNLSYCMQIRARRSDDIFRLSVLCLKRFASN